MKLSQVSGQPRPVSILTRALESGRPAQAYLFHGPESVGKELAARAFVASLCCSARSGTDACGHCGNCEKLARGVHPDLLAVLPEDEALARGIATKSDFDGKPSSTIRVSTVRDVNGWLASRPVEGTVRVALVIEAHQMGPEGQNALLKTLEEPRAGRVLILVSSAPSALLATVRSRCQKLRFGTLDDATVKKLLERNLGASVTAEAITRGVAHAHGSVARGIDAARDADDEQSDHLAALGRLAPGAILPVLDLAESLGGDRPGAVALLDALSGLLAQRARGEPTASPWLGSVPRRRATELLDHIARTRPTVSLGANVTLAVEDLLFAVCAAAVADPRTSARSAGR